MLTKRDIYLIVALVALAGALLLLLPLLRTQPEPQSLLYMRYTIGGVEGGVIPLTEERELTVDQGNGVQNTLRLWPDGFAMASSTCHNQLCVYQGEVMLENMNERPLYHMIVCAPHRLVAELLTGQELEGLTSEE